ncbi:Uncharacterized membrane-anchored protein [Desulfonispora thiosulfatigenes DSM 11270]|uniref:Uncharacterized membrane-anchored protein n=1 Tax=Desulfonispora thiosulfatigenes DSM 11270 TaxID=656914 RepID=A0A1W1VNX2_DESTI|nr:putative cytokinetic ring protein SteA [Desulfonispora thiosulfatigenes]SMB95026.1 Uncharacterized membrane-anchored protein [Desulfonispora thiosulfatigenes DSM 11270]
MLIKGSVVIDKKTKNLVKRILPGQIAIISHRDLDEIAAESLVEARVKAVLNTDNSLSELYTNGGPKILLAAGIPHIDCLGNNLISHLAEGDEITIKGNLIFINHDVFAKGRLITDKNLTQNMKIAQENSNEQLCKFLNNTLYYAVKEKDIFLSELEYPTIRTNIKGKQVVVVIRGKGYKNDLLSMKEYIKENRPLLIGVDGGADAILEIGLKPDLIVGDMDSVSDEALCLNCERIVHAYTNGSAPGIQRLKALGLDYITFAAPGTSEDIAMLLAYEKGAEKIIAIGTHTNMIDFMEKGRNGMGSTFLVRLKIGNKLIDAKGFSTILNPV